AHHHQARLGKSRPQPGAGCYTAAHKLRDIRARPITLVSPPECPPSGMPDGGLAALNTLPDRIARLGP
ncbi:MAG: hypothetical protein AAB654_10200, partial [Acidobacteriota bacterium]